MAYTSPHINARIVIFLIAALAGSLLMASAPASAKIVNGDIAFMTDRDSNDEIYRMNPQGDLNSIKRLTTNAASDRGPSWSPDGKNLAFVRDMDIYVMDEFGINPSSLPQGADNKAGPEYSHDGSKIAYASNAQNVKGDIYVMDVGGGNPTPVTDSASMDAAPTWSPDGTKIAFVSDRDGNNEIYVKDAALAAIPIRLTTNAGTDSAPDWSPDGTKIAFHTNRGNNVDIYVISATGGTAIPLTDDAANDVAPEWSPDGSKIAFSSKRDGDSEIYVMDDDGTDEVNITNEDSSEETVPAWQPVVVPDPVDPVAPAEPVPSTPASPASPTAGTTASDQKLTPSAYKKACNLRVTGMSFKKAKRSYTKTKEIIKLRASRKTVRKYLTGHGFKGVVKYGSVNGKPVKCTSFRMLVLKRSGSRYKIPGTNIKVSGKRLRRNVFAKKAVKYLKKKRNIGSLRLKSRSKEARFSYKNCNSKLRLCRKSFKSLRRANYRGTYSLIYVAEVNGKLIQKEIRLTTSKTKRK